MKSKKILIAHQDNASVKSLSTFLHGLGYGIEEAGEVGGIIRKIRNDQVHVILIDDEIEGVKAWDLVSLIKKINSRIQIIVISSEETIGPVKRLRAAGIFYQAMKPADLEEIGAAVRCAFEKVERENPREGFFSFLMPQWAPT
jgi:DNA-binding NtrC family response regulator